MWNFCSYLKETGKRELTNHLTISVEQSPSSEANRSSASLEIIRNWWNQMVHYHSRKRLPTVPILSQSVRVHISPSHYLKIRFNTILPSTHRSSHSLVFSLWAGLAGTRAQSGDRYGSDTLHSRQVLRGSLPLLSPDRSSNRKEISRVAKVWETCLLNYPCNFAVDVSWHEVSAFQSYRVSMTPWLNALSISTCKFMLLTWSNVDQFKCSCLCAST
jgi:hypothetical protein